MPSPMVHFWRRTPFTRFLLPLMAGIIIQWYSQLSLAFWCIVSLVSLVFILSFFTLPFFRRYALSWLAGFYIMLLFIAAGALLAWRNDIRHNKKWVGNAYSADTPVVVSLDEPLVEKVKSYKADASVNYILREGKQIEVRGKIIIYFKKDSLLPGLDYGTQIILNKPLQEIKNSGNPGGFDYNRYSLFNGITHQVYLKPGEFEVLHEKRTSLFQKIFYPARERVLKILRDNIKGDKELGLAEALLIGYKNDLDKTLVQSYTNTGVVHVIAISGLHIGLIYWLLAFLLKPLGRKRQTRWLQPVLIISGLWAFSLLAGGQPSVLRSAVMFTCIGFGQFFGKNTSIYNTLAFSAFILLCYNPYWLWDVGFQLSYSAVLSIVIFMKPIYHLLYIKNKLFDFIWKLNAVTLAAQILTLPVSVFHFHQFPASFWITNFLAVPLSSLIVLGEILLCAVSFFPSVALLTGKLLSWLIMLMNNFVERIELLPFALLDGLQINMLQLFLLAGFAAGLGFWLLEKMQKGLTFAMVCWLCFFAVRSYSFVNADKQEKIIVYNVPQRQAIDFINGRNYFFYGDSNLQTDDFARNFHLKPSRILHRIEPVTGIKGLVTDGNYAIYKDRTILLADKTIFFKETSVKPVIDLLVVSKNPKLYISRLSGTFTIKQVVFDGSVPFWKLPYWKRDCDSLHIPYHDVSEKGAFVMNLN
ncbi:MAG TPA: ComEC/Rec2 family competence protein [Chitinophagaceae bacterium]